MGLNCGDDSGTKTDYHSLIEKIKAGDISGEEELYNHFHRGLEYLLRRRMSGRCYEEVEDALQDVFLIAIKQIRNAVLRNDDCLLAFLRTVAERRAAFYLEKSIRSNYMSDTFEGRGESDPELPVVMFHCGPQTPYAFADHKNNPEREFQLQQRSEIMREALEQLNDRDREILTRYYLEEQKEEQICEEMALTATQYRLLKSRAKSKLGEIGRRIEAGRKARLQKLKAVAA